MSDKFRNKYRIDSVRLPTWDYGWNAAYFITINCKNKSRFFGNIEKGLMNRSKIGEIAETCWQAIPQHFPFVKLGAYVIMPDHLHGIIIINKVKTQDVASQNNVETQDVASLQRPRNEFGPQSKNLASIVRGFKVGVTKNARLVRADFAWQPRYHDSILFDDASFRRATQYIIDNPAKWQG